MKKIFSKIGRFFTVIFSILIALLFGIIVVLLIPFDYIKYKRSLYYKMERKKYELYAASGFNFDLYNEIIKNDLPIKYVYNPNNDGLEYGWFVCGNTLIIPNILDFEYDLQSEKWNFCSEDGTESLMSLDEYIETEIWNANELAGGIICDKAVVLIEADCIENLEQAKQEKRFLIYCDDRVEVLKNFCDNSF